MLAVASKTYTWNLEKEFDFILKEEPSLLTYGAI